MVSSFLQWQCAQDIKVVSDYHRSMSIPAISILEKIRFNFQDIHISSIDAIKTDLISEHVDKHHPYQTNKDEFLVNVGKYDSLTYAQNSKGEFLAGKIMQEQMQGYSHIYRQVINSNDVVIEQFKNGELTASDAIFQLTSIEVDFHNTIDENSIMEINGMEKNQVKILEIEKKMEIIFFSSASMAVISTILIVIFTTRFVSNPISKLVGVTKEIAKGKTVSIEKNSRNSDVNDVQIALNQMSKDLEKYRKKIVKQEKLSTIGELSSRLAHDIRNPLTIIKVSLDIMKSKKDLSEDELNKFQRVDDAIYRITHQVDNVLDFVKGKSLKISTYTLQEILNSVMEDLPESKNVQFTDQNLEIKCDFQLMKVVLINLIINAIQATKNNGKIVITSEKKDSEIVIQIEDDGPGIPEDKLEEIFEPLFTTKQEGTGLGLASCKSIIEKHGGTISAKNNPTRFIIRIPQDN